MAKSKIPSHDYALNMNNNGEKKFSNEFIISKQNRYNRTHSQKYFIVGKEIPRRTRGSVGSRDVDPNPSDPGEELG